MVISSLSSANTIKRNMDKQLQTGVRLFNTLEFFECHEVLEAIWALELGPSRLFLQSLIHIAVGFYHCQRGNPAGASRSQVSADPDAHRVRQPVREPNLIDAGQRVSGFRDHTTGRWDQRRPWNDSQKYAGNRRGVGALLLTHQVWGVLFVFAEVFNELSIRKQDEMYGC